MDDHRSDIIGELRADDKSVGRGIADQPTHPVGKQDVRDAVVQAGLKRIRPSLMTISTTIFGLMPIFWATGRGSDVMQPMAIPVMGGMTVSLITLFIVPCMFCAVEEWKWRREQR